MSVKMGSISKRRSTCINRMGAKSENKEVVCSRKGGAT